MSYDMRPVSLKIRMAGRAKTALFGPSGEKIKTKNTGPVSAVQIIDESGSDDILVVVTDDLNVTGLHSCWASRCRTRTGASDGGGGKENGPHDLQDQVAAEGRRNVQTYLESVISH